MTYMDLEAKQLRDIAKETGCIKPCKYKKYRLNWDPEPMPQTFKYTDGFGLWASTIYSMVGNFSLLSTLSV